MVSGYSTRKRFEKQNPGENSNTWGGFLNSNTIDIIDEAFGAVCVALTTAGDMTLSTANGSSDEGRNSILILTGTPTSNVHLYVPAVESFYFIRNKMAGAKTVKITCNGGIQGVDFSGSGSGAEQGVVVADGTYVREVARTVSVGAFTIFSRGMIMPFFNSVGAIPTGWLLCDGTNNTPNMNQRFILGTSSNALVDTSGGSLSLLTTTSAGNHSHGGVTGATTLTSAMIPAHTHYLFRDDSSGVQATLANSKMDINGSYGNSFAYGIAGAVTTAQASIGQSSWAYTSSPTSHTHTISTDTGHFHTVTPVIPPYHQMLYIMKS